MKKVSLVFTLVLGFAATSFAQPGAAKCAVNLETHFGDQPIESFPDIVLLGISNSEGDPAYSVSLTADFSTGKASKVMLTEIKSGKKWSMTQAAYVTKALPAPCSSYQGPMGEVVAYKSATTNVVVYAAVPIDGTALYVFAYKPVNVKFTL